MVKELKGDTMSENDFSRAPDSRWQAAVQLANKPEVLCRSDPLIRRVADYLRLQSQARTSAARTRQQERSPTIATALRIRFSPHDDRRDAIEVRALAGYRVRGVVFWL